MRSLVGSELCLRKFDEPFDEINSELALGENPDLVSGCKRVAIIINDRQLHPLGCPANGTVAVHTLDTVGGNRRSSLREAVSFHDVGPEDPT
jgi:hypothetical protein